MGRCRSRNARFRSCGSSRHYLDDWRWRPNAWRWHRPSDAAMCASPLIIFLAVDMVLADGRFLSQQMPMRIPISFGRCAAAAAITASLRPSLQGPSHSHKLCGANAVADGRRNGNLARYRGAIAKGTYCPERIFCFPYCAAGATVPQNTCTTNKCAASCGVTLAPPKQAERVFEANPEI